MNINDLTYLPKWRIYAYYQCER